MSDAFNDRLPSTPIPVILQGQKALVTGASSGIGRAIALALGAAGADVAVNYVDGEAAAQEVVNSISALGARAIAIKADVSSETEVQAMFQLMIQEFGTIDILVNNAGLQRDAPFDQMTLAQWNFVIGINLTGQFLCAREALREFKRRGVVKQVSVAAGKIICISSVHDGIMMMMKSLAQEVAPLHIRVNSICPGAIRTPINTAAWDTPAAYASLLRHIPYQRIGEPEDIGRVAVMLASDLSDYITGASIFVDGGMTLYPEFSTGG
jgi:glucose 1-dehydrogenase